MHKASTALGHLIAASLMALLAQANALAQLGAPQAVDCAKARDPEGCVARQQARAACGDKRGPERRECVRAHLPPPDCAKAAKPARCLAEQAAQEACKGKVGAAHRQCLRDTAAKP